MSQRALTELLRGQGAHADPIACVEDVSSELASQQVAGFPHSIGQILFHVNYWMNYELRRIRGEKPKYPEHSGESFPAAVAVSTAEWDQLRRDFAWFLGEYEKLVNTSPAELNREIDSDHEVKNANTLADVLWQMVAHNSYHVGQIVMLRQALGAWPPRGGGDSW
ncbi:MAG: DinB family protein [Candidatus Sulfotelmatobacter sp.]